MKADYDALYRMLMGISSELSSYDKERCQTRAESLLKQIGERESSKAKGFKPFFFKKKLKVIKKVSKPDPTNVHEQQNAPVTIEKNFILTEPTAVYEGLDYCSVTTGKETPTAKSGSLILRNVNHTLIKCQPLTFQSGSLFITDCENIAIMCDLPPQNAVQVRLRNSRNCKLVLNVSDSTTKQIVILENCSGCIFHQATAERLVIKNFTDLNLTDGAHQDYKFESFEIPS